MQHNKTTYFLFLECMVYSLFCKYALFPLFPKNTPLHHPLSLNKLPTDTESLLMVVRAFYFPLSS